MNPTDFTIRLGLASSKKLDLGVALPKALEHSEGCKTQ